MKQLSQSWIGKLIFILAGIAITVVIVFLSGKTANDQLGGQVRSSNNVNITSPVNNGTNNTVLFINGSGLLSSTTALGFNATSGLLTVSGGLSFIGASDSTNFEVTGYASASSVFVTNNLITGSNTASGSSIYSGEFVSTGTTSLNFTGSSVSKGTCLQMKNTTGNNVYIRVYGTTLTVTSVKCHQ